MVTRALKAVSRRYVVVNGRMNLVVECLAKFWEMAVDHPSPVCFFCTLLYAKMHPLSICIPLYLYFYSIDFEA